MQRVDIGRKACNEWFAKAYFDGRNPLGRHIALWKDGRPVRDMEVAGVSRDVHYGGLKRDVVPVAYIAYNQGYPEPDRMVYQLRTAGDPMAYINSVREIVHQADSRLPLTKVKTARTTKATISEISMLTPIWAITTWMPKICRAM